MTNIHQQVRTPFVTTHSLQPHNQPHLSTASDSRENSFLVSSANFLELGPGGGGLNSPRASPCPKPAYPVSVPSTPPEIPDDIDPNLGGAASPSFASKKPSSFMSAKKLCASFKSVRSKNRHISVDRKILGAWCQGSHGKGGNTVCPAERRGISCTYYQINSWLLMIERGSRIKFGLQP